MDKASVVEVVCEFVLEHMKIDEVCGACLRQAKSQSSHDHDRCLMLYIRAFIRSNLPAIIESAKIKLNSTDSVESLKEIITSPSTFVAVAWRIE